VTVYIQGSGGMNDEVLVHPNGRKSGRREDTSKETEEE
jgi:hypothetical protein